MAKRFIDTTIWTHNKWFRKLEPEMKLLWIYLFSNCDNVGVWEEDIELASFIIGVEYKEDNILEFRDKLLRFNGKKYWIIDFCNFQYGELKEDNIKNKPHQSYISLLKKHSLWKDYKKTLESLKEKDKDKEDDKDKDDEKIHFSKSSNIYSKEVLVKELKEDAYLSQTIENNLKLNAEMKDKLIDKFIKEKALELHRTYGEITKHLLNWGKTKEFKQEVNLKYPGSITKD